MDAKCDGSAGLAELPVHFGALISSVEKGNVPATASLASLFPKSGTPVGCKQAGPRGPCTF
jgi:hypothetical protein